MRLLVLLLLVASPLAAQDDVPAHQVKAAFIYNFTKFVTWPAASFSSPSQPIRLGVMGQDALADALRVVEGRTAQGRSVEVRRLAPGDDPKTCHLLYVAASEAPRLAKVLAATSSAPVLTIGDVPGFVIAGGVFNFFVEGDRVRMEVCPARAAARGLRISSKLLQVSRVVDCKP